ncbi:hypothetical protein DFH09DRAFT_1309601 [Mycena vulgaris]|nr:hypothetical protein DFH09DRAFT_1309601 [Mycena vulgaris]
MRWPDSPAYWSLDSLGAERLSMEDATHLGFPSVERYTKIWIRSWDDSVYAGLRQFHQAKGFDLESRDVAPQSGHPLYQLSDELNHTFAYVDEEDPCTETVEQIVGSRIHDESTRVGEADAPCADEQDSTPEAPPRTEASDVLDETAPVSSAFTFRVSAQLLLIISLTLSTVYERMVVA